MHLQWAVACLDGSRDITASAQHVSISGMLTVGLAGRDFDIHLDNPNVTISGFNLDLGGIPGEIVSMLSIDTALGPVLGWVAEQFIVPMLNSSLAGLNDTRTVDVMGTPVDIDVAPESIDFSTQGALIQLDTTLRAHGDTGKFVYV